MRRFRNVLWVMLASVFAGGGLAVAAEPQSAATSAEAAQRLREAVEHCYSHYQARAANWPTLWPRYEPRLNTAATPREFALAAGELLASTGDPHIWLELGGEVIPAFRRNVPPNVQRDLLPRLVSQWTQPNRVVAIGWVAPGVGYLAIHSWSNKQGLTPYEPVFQALEQFQVSRALVIDVRLNSGGDDRIAREFAGCFLEQRALYARVATLDATSATGFTPPVERWVEPAARPHYAGKVAVLIGPVNMSSAESFILMMKQSPAVTLVGQRTYGSSGNPQPHALGNGVTVNLPSWRAFAPDGAAIEGKGIAPDINVPFQPGRDAVLAKALTVLRSNATKAKR